MMASQLSTSPPADAEHMQWVDTHAHVFQPCFSDDESDMLARCRAQRLTKIYMPNLSVDTIAPMLAMAQRHPTLCFAAIGLHPCYVTEGYQQDLAVMERHLAERQFVAIGETGIDLYHSSERKKEQIASFQQHCLWAAHYDLPLIVHCRDAFALTLSVLEQLPSRPRRGIFHCFTGGAEEAHRVLSLGYYLGIGGIISYKNSEATRRVLTPSMLSRIVLETDSPYLAPSGLSTRRNEPSFVPLIGKQVAKYAGVSVAQVARITTQNAHEVFAVSGLPHDR